MLVNNLITRLRTQNEYYPQDFFVHNISSLPVGIFDDNAELKNNYTKARNITPIIDGYPCIAFSLDRENWLITIEFHPDQDGEPDPIDVTETYMRKILATLLEKGSHVCDSEGNIIA